MSWIIGHVAPLEASDFPTAPWHDAVINLCRAVESEMASTLGTQPGLEFLAVAARLELGAKAKRLQHLDGELCNACAHLVLGPGCSRNSRHYWETLRACEGPQHTRVAVESQAKTLNVPSEFQPEC